MGFSKTGSDPVAKGYEVDDPREVEQLGDMDTEYDFSDSESVEEMQGREGFVRRFRHFAKRDKQRTRKGGS